MPPSSNNYKTFYVDKLKPDKQSQDTLNSFSSHQAQKLQETIYKELNQKGLKVTANPVSAKQAENRKKMEQIISGSPDQEEHDDDV